LYPFGGEIFQLFWGAGHSLDDRKRLDSREVRGLFTVISREDKQLKKIC
jgi:hypothetical protein